MPAGQARKRFGGNIPLIGICNWGNIQQRTPLTVRKSGVKLGYVTSPPVSYEKTQYGTDAANPALDPNHSHFIMVPPLCTALLPIRNPDPSRMTCPFHPFSAVGKSECPPCEAAVDWRRRPAAHASAGGRRE